MIPKIISVILSFGSTLLIPILIDYVCIICGKHSIVKSFKFRSYVIMLLRSSILLIFPFIFSILILDDCSKMWTLLWKPCNNTSNFNIYFNTLVGVNEKLLSYNDICGIVSPFSSDFTINKCFRSFWFKWSNILITKMIIMVFMPLIIIILKQIKHKILNKLCTENKSLVLIIDYEYFMIINKLEIIICFGIICPLLIPIILLTIYLIPYYYYIMINKLQYKIKFKYCNYRNNFKIPIGFLWISIITQQIFSILFIQYSIHFKHYTNINSYISIIISIIMIILDIYGIWFSYKKRSL